MPEFDARPGRIRRTRGVATGIRRAGGAPWKILYVSHVSALGGAEHSLLDLLHSLDRHRFAPLVVVPAPGELSRHLEEAGIPFECCAFLHRLHRTRRPHRAFAQAGWLLLGSLTLHRLIRRHRPHLLHANSTTSSLYALCLPWRPAVPVLWHLRDLRLPRSVGRWLAPRVKCIVVPSEACRKLVEPMAGAVRIERIPNGIRIDGAVHGSAELRREIAPGEGPLAVMVGHLAPWKGHALVIEAARRVREQNPAVRFVLIGDDRFGDHPGAFERLRQQVRESGLEGTVRLLGHREDARAIIQCADLLLHPAFPEPFGRVVVEAMAVGCPVVVFAGEHGPPEILKGEAAGVLVAPRTAEALAQAVLDLVARPDLREQLGEVGHRRASTFYDHSIMGRRFEALYETYSYQDPSR